MQKVDSVLLLLLHLHLLLLLLLLLLLFLHITAQSSASSPLIIRGKLLPRGFGTMQTHLLLLLLLPRRRRRRRRHAAPLMKARRTCGGSVIEPRGHSLTLHQHPAGVTGLASLCCFPFFYARRIASWDGSLVLTERGRSFNAVETSRITQLKGHKS